MILLEATPSERAAYLTYVLASGRSVTAQEAAELVRISERAAQRTLAAISRTVPLIREQTGEWRLLDEEPGRISPF